MEIEPDVPETEYLEGSTKTGIVATVGDLRTQLGKRGLRVLFIDSAFVVTAALIIAFVLRSMKLEGAGAGSVADTDTIMPVLLHPGLLFPVGLIGQAVGYACFAIFGSNRKQAVLGMLFTIGLLVLGYFAGFLAL